MKKAVSLILSAALATSLCADLLQDAKDAGLRSLPKNQTEVDEVLTELGLQFTQFTQDKADLGRKLYFDPRLSKSGIISCNTCHNLSLGGVDGVSAAVGHRWTANPHNLNSPTVYNSLMNSLQFWDGRASSLADQAKGPIEAEPEMATPAALAVERISSIPVYVSEFKRVYGEEGVSFDNIADAIANFERTLITPSRFDYFLDGEQNALTTLEKEGLRLFIDKGCVACHTDRNLGGTMQPFQVANQYKFANVGDFKGDANGMVKTPTLRNVAETAPYFHNGQFWELKDAIKEMGSVQLGIEINDLEASKIESFLKSLTGLKPLVIYPVLPPSTSKTPKPEL